MTKRITSIIVTLAMILSISSVYTIPAQAAATAPDGYITDEHGSLAYSSNVREYGYDVQGYVDGSWRQVTFDYGGFAARVYNGSGISVSAPAFEFVADGQGLLMTYTLTNTSESTVSDYRFAIAADTMVNENDYSTNTVDDNVLTMSYAGVSFFGFSITDGATIIPTNYYPEFVNVADNGADPSLTTPVYTECDSAFVLYFDTATLAPGASSEYTFIVGMGDVSSIDSIINTVKKAVMNTMIDYENERLLALDAGATYKITCDSNLFNVIASENGTISLSGVDKDGKSYNFIGKTISIVRLAGGEYTTDSDPLEIVVSNSTNAPETVSPTTPAETVSEEPVVPAEAVAAAVTGEESLTVTAAVSNGEAKVSDFTKAQLTEITNEQITDTISIDTSASTQYVRAVELSTETFSELAEVVSDEANAVDTVSIKTKNVTVEIDAATMNAVLSQATGSTIELVVDANLQSGQLTDAQQEVLSEMEVAQTFEAYFISNGQRIGNFNGGSAIVSLGFNIPEGKDAKYYHIYYLQDDGTMTHYATRYNNGRIEFTANHFSDYCIIYDETLENETVAAAAPAVQDVYVVKKGDCFWAIARKMDMTLEDLVALNPDLAAQKYIYAGQQVTIVK